MLCVSWAPCFLGTVGQKSGFALYSSFPICFFPSWLLLGQNRCFPICRGRRGGRQHATPPSPFSPMQLQLRGTTPGRSREVPRDASPFSHHSLPPSSSSLLVCMSLASAAKGHAGPLSPMASLPPL